MSTAESRQNRRNWLRTTLDDSRREAAGSAVMTGISDNYIAPLAVFLKASASQLGLVTALPQLAGALSQLLSVWLGTLLQRRVLILVGVALQAMSLLGMAIVALSNSSAVLPWLIGLACLYQACGNLVNPHWRNWMGAIVPARRRGAYFAGRTRLTMLVSFLVFVAGGLLLGKTDALGWAAVGFFVIYLQAFGGRLISLRYMYRMHDPEPGATEPGVPLMATLQRIGQALQNRSFVQYSLYVAGLQGAMGISGPYFALHMLRDLEWSYLQFTVSTGVSIAVQFFTLPLWGRVCDRWGTHFAMVASSLLLPFLPLGWVFTDNFYWILVLQVFSGIAWGGFTLASANYIYDLRPPRTHFPAYAALQAALSAAMLSVGILFGGFLGDVLPPLLPDSWHPLYGVMLASSLVRGVVVAVFIPKATHLPVQQRPSPMQVIYRIARFNSASEMVLDWLTVSRKTGNSSPTAKRDTDDKDG